MNYVEHARTELVKALGIDYNCEPRLTDLYALLVLVRGEDCTLEDVHEAWAIWRNNSNPEHASIVPFSELTEEIRAYDEPYRKAIVKAAEQVSGGFSPRYRDRKWRELA